MISSLLKIFLSPQTHESYSKVYELFYHMIRNLCNTLPLQFWVCRLSHQPVIDYYFGFRYLIYYSILLTHSILIVFPFKSQQSNSRSLPHCGDISLNIAKYTQSKPFHPLETIFYIILCSIVVFVILLKPLILNIFQLFFCLCQS